MTFETYNRCYAAANAEEFKVKTKKQRQKLNTLTCKLEARDTLRHSVDVSNKFKTKRLLLRVTLCNAGCQ